MAESLCLGGKMILRKKLIFSLAGIIAAGVGIVFAIPGMLKENYLLAIGGTMLLVAGLVLLALSFTEE